MTTEQRKPEGHEVPEERPEKKPQAQRPVEPRRRKAVHGPPNDKALKPQQDKG